MLPTFVIGLREGLEAALIVGIIAAFLRKQGRTDLLLWVFAGVGVAVLLCAGVGITLNVVSRDLPQRQQEGLETVIGVLAVGMVSYMVIWMRRHSRELRGQLEGMAADAMNGPSGAGRAMVLMAFLAVLREGFETVVFLLAAFNESGSGIAAGAGAVLGLAVAVALGYGIYRGGVHINLSKFFRATGLVLVLVAAGLVVNALHTAHEAGWLTTGQASTVDLTWLVRPGSVQASLLTGMLGLQPRPVVIEVVGWLVYLIPVGLYVAWAPGRGLSRRALSRVMLVGGSVAVLAAIVLGLVMPGFPQHNPVTSSGAISAQLVEQDGASATVRTQTPPSSANLADTSVRRSGSEDRAGMQTDVYSATMPGTASSAQPSTLSLDRIAQLNGGRLPIGLSSTQLTTANIPVTYTDTGTLTVWTDPNTGRVIDLQWRERVTAAVTSQTVGAIQLATPVSDTQAGFDAAVATEAGGKAHSDADQQRHHQLYSVLAWSIGIAGAIMLAIGLITRFRRPNSSVEIQRTGTPTPAATAVRLG
jgi:high-affinity iron transporter